MSMRGPEDTDEEFSDRAKRLTPREWRVVALSIEGVAAEDACAALGIAEGTLKSHKQAIRRKLGVPRGKRLERHLREHMEALPANIRPTVAAAAEAQQVPVERSVMEKRVRLLLRLTLQELLEVADNADLRAALLQQTVQRIESADAAEAQQVPVERSVMEKRVRLLLRLTLQELLEVADNADLRAALLQQTVQRIESEDAEEARREVEDLQIAAREIRDTFERVRADIRERGRRLSPNGG